MAEPKIKLMLVTDDPDTLIDSDTGLLQANDVELVSSPRPHDDIQSLVTIHQPDVVVMDYDLLDFDAAETARGILHEEPATQIIMVSVVGDTDDIRHAMRAGARDYLIKPLAAGELIETIRWLIHERRQYAKTRAFIGQMRKAFETMFYDDKPVPDNVVHMLEVEARKKPLDRLTQETLAVAYARNREWARLLPIVEKLAGTQLD